MQPVASLPAISRPPSIGRFGPNRLVIGASALGIIAAAAAWQWSWLVAIGVAPLLLSIALCAAMCGLGLCMHRGSGRPCAPTPKGPQAAREAAGHSATPQET